MKTYNIKRTLKTKCHRCREELNTAEKYFLDRDSKEWYCDQCGSKYFVCGGMEENKDFAEEDADDIIIIKVFHTNRSDEVKETKFGLYKNSHFKLIKGG